MVGIRVIERKLFVRGLGILGPKTSELRLTISFEPELLAQIAQSAVELVAKFVPEEAASIQNIKGRDAGERLISTDPAAQRPQQDELLYLAGEIFNDAKGLDRDPISLSILSKFEKFTSDGGIVFEVKRKNRGDFEELSPRALTRAFPMELGCVRAGLQFFKPKRVPFLGLSPAVVETVLIEAASGLCCLSLSGQIRGNYRESFPLSSEAYQAVSEFMIKAFGVSLDEHWSKAHISIEPA